MSWPQKQIDSAWFFGWRGCAFVMLFCTVADAQIVINEVVKEERTAGSGSVSPDVREFVELYNAGATPVDLSSWSLSLVDLGSGATSVTDTIPSGTIAPGDYFVVGGAAVPNVDYSPIATDLYADSTANIIELKNNSGTVVDAVAYEVYRTGLGAATAAQLAEIGRGFQGQLLSMNASAPNEVVSWARYRNGVDTNQNALDFGILPVTPGASNELAHVAAHGVPDVDALSTGSSLSSDYYASFLMPRVVDPTVATGINPRSIPVSPQGGKAIVAWDETGGGNAAFSKSTADSFELYAYFDTSPLGVAVDTNDEEWETTTYGIGSTDPFFGHPDPSGGIFVPGHVTQNGSSGVGWVYQQYENPTDSLLDFSRLMLVDFGLGGNSTAEAGEWTVIQTIDMTAFASDWYQLGIDYDPVTGNVVANFDGTTYNFARGTDLVGSFFVGYREGITSQGSRFDKLNPPIYDLFVSAGGLAGDFNGDGTVDAADYTLWRDNLGATEDGSVLSGNGDGGTVGTTDYELWRDNYGNSSSSSEAVPEPASFVLLAIMATALAGRRATRL